MIIRQKAIVVMGYARLIAAIKGIGAAKNIWIVGQQIAWIAKLNRTILRHVVEQRTHDSRFIFGAGQTVAGVVPLAPRANKPSVHQQNNIGVFLKDRPDLLHMALDTGE